MGRSFQSGLHNLKHAKSTRRPILNMAFSAAAISLRGHNWLVMSAAWVGWKGGEVCVDALGRP
ncbi:hypothetical protein ASPCADRAFT_207856 [Aspergillus carbonarius ITEM 5010]|uniref:Uncharacterized protein n=1 Tax=Aspergillus carbonarius (strain ITEM 5010) TaxID=602072 RepID=A0A1R3RLN4_ASPC5|nr:hypothetical protein ASPCADRAFT_207856 [Aspergillus carbonarius ITEM 5010]